MDLHLVPDVQLLEIYKLVKIEIRQRFVTKKKRTDVFQNELLKFKSNFPDDFLEDLYEKHKLENNLSTSSFLSLRKNDLKCPLHARMKYLWMILDQDWSSLFHGGDLTKKYYVYFHVDLAEKFIALPKRLGIGMVKKPFYVGKGTNNRAYELKRNEGHGKKIRNIISDGHNEKDIVCIIKNLLTEGEAYELEAKLIYFFGTIFEKDRDGILLNLNIPRLPVFTAEMPKIIKPLKEKKCN